MSGWARRRAAVAAEARAEAEARAAARRQAEAQALEERPDAELLAEAGLKEPEALVSAEEVRAFLKHALPERLKRRALRRLWGLNPVLANVDGLVDYGEDFTDAAVCVENLQTLYTVGKGMLEQFRVVEDTEEATEVALVGEGGDEVPDQVRDGVAAVDGVPEGSLSEGGGPEVAASRPRAGTSALSANHEVPDQVRDGVADESEDGARCDGLSEGGGTVLSASRPRAGTSTLSADHEVRDGDGSAPLRSGDSAFVAPRAHRMRFTFERI